MVSRSERFEKYVFPVTEGGCWVWMGSLSHLGYGRFAYGNGQRGHEKAHRASWELHRGPIPDGLHVLHRCDVRCCVNPNHLFLGTRSDNMRDMWSKGRHPGNSAHVSGEKHPRSKLTAEQVKAIRGREGPHRPLAEEFGVCIQRISAIRNYQTWKHIT